MIKLVVESWTNDLSLLRYRFCLGKMMENKFVSSGF